MATPISNLVYAKRWEITQGFIRTRADYQCGSCSKMNFKQVIISCDHKTLQLLLAASQCQWSGEINAFRDGKRYITLDGG